MKYSIRRMNIRDHASVLALWKRTPGIGLEDDSDSRAGLGRYLKRNPGLSFVALINSSIAGAVLSGHDGRRGYLHHLAVSPECRKKGIGKRLVDCCLKQLKKNNIPKCNIFLFKANRSGRAFWVHDGWNLRPDLSLLQKWTGPR